MPRKLTDTDFSNKYNAIVNHIDANAGFGGFNNNSDGGCLFETFGNELEFVRKQNSENHKKVWTILEADGETYISAGYHFVNRIGYLITEQEWENEFEEYLLD